MNKELQTANVIGYNGKDEIGRDKALRDGTAKVLCPACKKPVNVNKGGWQRIAHVPSRQLYYYHNGCLNDKA